MGRDGFVKMGRICFDKAHRFADMLESAGLKRAFKGDFFNEFTTVSPDNPGAVLSALESEGILGGLQTDKGIIWCVTELVSEKELARAAGIVERTVKHQ
ncbi:hypothetical protein SDC9_115253 [bioreactor metagenome]|uniref:Glycine dehydrogenase (aminomethyl-transferring) n=1 Tax=bioreactor metagenome TaxID=1076179 RepID=A0A645BUM3_9ZZZZ